MMRGRATLRARQRGAATIEFYVTAFLVLVPLLMAVMQMGMFMLAKNTVNLAALSVARAGAASGGDRGEMRRAYATALAPLYAARGLGAAGGGGLRDVSAGNYAQVMGVAYASAMADISTTFSSFTSLNPTRASFQDFGVNRNGATVIPVYGLASSNPVGSRSQQRRSDALLLKVQVRHCYVMVFPIIDALVTGVLNSVSSGASATDRLCYARSGVPIVSQAVVRMTVPPVASNFN
jgi:hypothetical protein